MPATFQKLSSHLIFLRSHQRLRRWINVAKNITDGRQRRRAYGERVTRTTSPGLEPLANVSRFSHVVMTMTPRSWDGFILRINAGATRKISFAGTCLSPTTPRPLVSKERTATRFKIDSDELSPNHAGLHPFAALVHFGNVYVEDLSSAYMYIGSDRGNPSLTTGLIASITSAQTQVQRLVQYQSS